MHARVSVITAVYRKSLRLSMSAKQADTVGNCLNLMAVDARRLNDWLPYLHNMWSSPLQIVISMVMLWEQIGPAVLAGLAVMLIVMPLNALMARVQQRMQRKLMAARDERVKVFNEVINGIKIIKMYAWETGFKEKIETTRAEEIRLLRNYRAFRIVSEMMWSAGEHTTTCEASSAVGLRLSQGGAVLQSPCSSLSPPSPRTPSWARS